MRESISETYWRIDPEIAGEIDEQSTLDTTVHPPKVNYLVYAVDSWSGDDVVQTFPCFLVTARLAKALGSAGLSGAKASREGVRVVFGEDSEIPQGLRPDFWRLAVSGEPGQDDFGLTEDAQLIVSQKALKFLQGFALNESVIEPVLKS